MNLGAEEGLGSKATITVLFSELAVYVCSNPCCTWMLCAVQFTSTSGKRQWIQDRLWERWQC